MYSYTNIKYKYSYNCKNLYFIQMKYLNGEYYVEVKDHRYKIHPTENIILRKRDEPKSLRTQYQVQNETQIRKNPKVIKNDNNQLVVKNYPENKNKHPIIQKQLPNCPSCKQYTWLEFDKGFYCTYCEYIINKQTHQIDEKIRRQDHDFSNRLYYAKTKIRDIYISIANSPEDNVIDKLQLIKGRSKLKFYKNISDYYKEMKNKNFQSNNIDPFSKNAKGVGKIYHEVLLLMEYLQTKPDIKNMNINYYDLYYTVIKTRNENKNIDNQYEEDYHNYIDINDFILTPNHYIGIKPRGTILK